MSKSVALVPVLTADINRRWDEILPWAEDFCQYSQGSYDPAYILDKLHSGQMQCWLVINDATIAAVCVSEIRQTKVKEFIIVIMTGHNMIDWTHLLQPLEKYARFMGCKKMKGIARPGWEKILKPYGYVKTHVEMEKEL